MGTRCSCAGDGRTEGLFGLATLCRPCFLALSFELQQTTEIAFQSAACSVDKLFQATD